MKTMGLLTCFIGAGIMLALTGALAQADCTPTGFFRDSINLTAALINPGDVTGPVNATGCNIGVYYSAGNTGTVDNAEVYGANYFGVAVNGDGGAVSVDVTNSSIHDIGEIPLDGNQHGVAVYYSACTATGSATGTIAGNTLTNYQKGGIVVNCSGAAASISGNTVSGQGVINYIAQNGIQVGFGASGQVMRNTVTGNAYSGVDNTVSVGILIFGGACYESSVASGIQVVKNTLDGNDVGIWLVNLGANCTTSTTKTNNKAINNVITNSAVTNMSGNLSPYGYQAGILDIGVNDKLINNSISGLGYTPSNCDSANATSICAIDTSAATSAKVHANAIP